MSWFHAAIFVSIVPIAFLLGRHLLRRRRRRQYCVREVPNFLSHDECDRIIELSRPLLEPGLVHGREGNRADKARQAEMAWVEEADDKSLPKIKQRLEELVGIPKENFESMQVIRYGVGGHYVPHVDYFAGSVDEIGTGGDRQRSVILYLNDDFDGGQTTFPKIGYVVHPEKGKAMVFDNLDPAGNPQPLSKHSGLVVLRGEKWIVNIIMREKQFGQPSNRAQRRKRASRAKRSS